MSWFRSREVYDRNRLLEQAARARRRGRRKRAIALYQQVLAMDPEDPQVNRRIAALFAKTKRPAEAWESYRRAAARLARQGFVEQAIGIYREASTYLARERQLWLALAELEVERGRGIDAAFALLEGSRHLRGRRNREAALALLTRAREIQPSAFEPSFALAGLLLRTGQKARGRRILAELERHARGRELRRLRGRQLRVSPSPRAAWRWLVAAVGSR
jgi:tetratricopeptide (TPR) repeat protein